MGPLLLLLTTFIWGTAFVAQKVGSGSVGPFAMTAYRNLLGGLFLLSLIAVRDWRHGGCDETRKRLRVSVAGGLCCGLPLFFAMVAQQVGIGHTTPGVSAFLTTNYVLIIPVLCAIFLRRLPGLKVTLCALLALAGTYCLCFPNPFEPGVTGIGRGEAWTLLCAFLFAVQMMAVDRFAPRCDLLVLSATQLFACAVLGFPFLFLEGESVRLGRFLLPPVAALWPIFYCGVFSSGIAYTLQNYGQAKTPVTLAGILLSTESVFGALAGYVICGDRMSISQILGCAMVLSAVLLVQLRHHY